MKRTSHSEIALFLRLEPDIPRLTHQNGIKVATRGGKAVMYKSAELRNLEAKYCALLKPHAPSEPWNCPISLTTEWIFRKPKGAKGIFKTTKPDTDNLVKTLKDCMTRCGYWKDDALVVMDGCTKLWADENEPHGIIIRMTEPINFSIEDGE